MQYLMHDTTRSARFCTVLQGSDRAMYFFNILFFQHHEQLGSVPNLKFQTILNIDTGRILIRDGHADILADAHQCGYPHYPTYVGNSAIYADIDPDIPIRMISCYDINQRKNTSPFGFVKFCYFQPYLMAIPNSNTNLPTEQCMYTLCNGTTGVIDICFHLNLIRGMFSINLFSSFSVSIPLSMNVPKCIFNFYRSWWLGGSLIGG